MAQIIDGKALAKKIRVNLKEEVEELIKDVKDALAKDDIEDIKAKQEALNETAMALATKVYEQAAKEREAFNSDADDTPSSTKNDDVMDAEFEEK